MVGTSFKWDRFWFPAGKQISLIDGYLPDPESWIGPHLEVQGVRIEVLNAVPCVVLLGVPGMGKTSEMRFAADHAQGRGELVDFISLAALTGPADLYVKLIDGENQQEWTREDKVWNIFLDGLDEALAQLTQIEKAIPEVFRRLAERNGLKHLRLRISCRSAEWPQSLEAELRAIWNSENVRVYELGHLRRKDVSLAAAELFPAGQQNSFLEYVHEHEAEPLASRPITLNMLFNVFRQDAALPKQQIQLYRKGLLASIEEANDSRRANRQTWRLDIRSKLMVAARIAASTVFSNSYQIWTGRQSEVPPARSVVLSEIAGGYEPTAGSSFPVGEAELRDVLFTSLFVPISSNLFAWAHQTFAEFLAAYYLVEHDLTAEENLEFLCSSGDAGGQIPPQLMEVAAWLASMQPDFFRALIRSDPAILLRSDVAAASPEDREALVRELLQRFDNEELHDFRTDVRFRYERLRHPRLSEQIRPYISAKDKNVIVRRVAIDIAEANNLTDLGSLLVKIALDITDHIHIRAQAAAALSKIESPIAKYMLKPLLQGDQKEDIDDDLKGYALRSLWPAQLSVSELLEALTPPKNESYFGAYTFFLSDLEIPELSQADALAVIAWLAEALKDEKRHTAFSKVVPRLLARAFEASNNDEVRERLAELLLIAVRDGAFWSYSEQIQSSFSSILSGDDARRHNLVLTIIRKATVDYEKDQALLLGGPVSLLTKGDLSWLIKELGLDHSEGVKRALVNLIVGQTFGRSLDEISFVWEAADNSPLLSEALVRAYSVDLSSAVAKWQRDDFDRQQRRLLERREQPNEIAKRIEDDLSKFENQNSFDWWQLNLLFFPQANGANPASEFTSDLTKTAGWALLSESVHHRLIRLAWRYLVENRIRSTWLGTNTFHRPAAAGYRAIRLLYSEAQDLFSEIDKNVWRKWVVSIFGMSFNEDQQDREVKKRIVQRCYEFAPEQVRRTVKRLILKTESEYSVRDVLNTIEDCFDEPIGRLLWQILGQLSAGDTRRKHIVRFLVQMGYDAAVQLTLDSLNRTDAINDNHINGSDELVVAAAALIRRNAESVWNNFTTFRIRNEKLAKGILVDIADDAFHGQDPFYRRLSESQLADLFIWSYHCIPPPIEDRTGRARYLGVPDHVEQLRHAILRNLVGRGTADAVASVQEMADKLPEAAWLRWQVIDARRELAAHSWKRLSPAEVMAAIASFRPMPAIRSTKAAIKAATEAFQNAIQPLTQASPPTPATAPDTISFPQPPPVNVAPIRPRRILAVATEWSSGHGGISTLNRELCSSLAAAGHYVACLVIAPTPREIAEAAAVKVNLIGCPDDPTVHDLDRLLLFYPSMLPNFVPEVVIGHDHITGSGRSPYCAAHLQNGFLCSFHSHTPRGNRSL